jgi:hypothetical protein
MGYREVKQEIYLLEFDEIPFGGFPDRGLSQGFGTTKQTGSNWMRIRGTLYVGCHHHGESFRLDII